jgi:hypothetical protein
LRTGIDHPRTGAFAGGEEAKEQTKRLSKVHSIVRRNKTGLSIAALDP